MIVPLSVYLNDDDLAALQRVSEGRPVQEVLREAFAATVQQMRDKGQRGLEADRRISNGDLETGAAKEAFSDA